jgi:hypothetical protein
MTMGLWHFMQGDLSWSWDEDGVLVSSFDDGLQFIPGEDGFSTVAAEAKAASFSVEPAVVAVYTGTPGYAARIDAEEAAQQAAEAKAKADSVIDAMLNPVDPVDARKAEVNARFDALLSASNRASDIAALRAAAIAAVENGTAE